MRLRKSDCSGTTIMFTPSNCFKVTKCLRTQKLERCRLTCGVSWQMKFLRRVDADVNGESVVKLSLFVHLRELCVLSLTALLPFSFCALFLSSNAAFDVIPHVAQRSPVTRAYEIVTEIWDNSNYYCAAATRGRSHCGHRTLVLQSERLDLCLYRTVNRHGRMLCPTELVCGTCYFCTSA
ncbi:hypothetical protein TRVL_09012 [Trypanosoma vivax]|nr:hypothetical protein TRVL_09012 [Trypanosoma vivax]